jgi:glycosyltransferase involved in cell wall biosynthesis
MRLRLTYLSMDSLSEGVGYSQVFHYVVRLGRLGLAVELHTFEKSSASPELARRLSDAGVVWHPHRFGRLGALGGLFRVLRGAWLVRRAELLHARTDLAAACAVLARPRSWVWDMRSFWREQRVALGGLQPDSLEARVLARVERWAAERSRAIVVLAKAALPVLRERFGNSIEQKTHVIPTCVDLESFKLGPPPVATPIRLLLAGTLNAYYDIPTTLAFVEKMNDVCPTRLTVAAPGVTPWEALFHRAGIDRIEVGPEEMPDLIKRHHAGLSICRADGGISLRAAMPTKIGEFLATGRPVVVNADLGDAPELVLRNRCGVVLDSGLGPELELAAARLLELLTDAEVGARCREVAETHFSLEDAVHRLMQIYRRINDEADSSQTV